jgi:hypothetical protein
MLAAREICERFDGRFPDEAASLRSLPGVGAYTAGAIASMELSTGIHVIAGFFTTNDKSHNIAALMHADCRTTWKSNQKSPVLMDSITVRFTYQHVSRLK